MGLHAIYAAAAIDLANSGGFDPFTFIKKNVMPAKVYDPRAAFAGGAFDPSNMFSNNYIMKVNMAALEHAQMMVAYTDLKTPSFGVPIEMAFAKSKNIPVVLVVDAVEGWEMKLGVYARLYSDAIITSKDLNYEKLVQIYQDCTF